MMNAMIAVSIFEHPSCSARFSNGCGLVTSPSSPVASAISPLAMTGRRRGEDRVESAVAFNFRGEERERKKT